MPDDKGLKTVINKIMEQEHLTYEKAAERFKNMTIQEKEKWNKIAGGVGRGKMADSKFSTMPRAGKKEIKW